MGEITTDMVEEVLLRTDLPEVMAFKTVSVFYRDLIGLPGFSERYNRHRRRNCNWLVTLVRTKENSRFGHLYWLRPSDEKRMYVDLRPYLVGNPHQFMDDPDDQLFLLGASGSVLVFRALSKFIIYLFTINIFTNETVYLPVPGPHLFFDNPRNLKTLTHPDINLAFRIFYTQVVNDGVPRYCELSTVTNNWEFLLDAIPAEPDDLNRYDPRITSLASDIDTCFISFRNHLEHRPIFVCRPAMIEIPPLYDEWDQYFDPLITYYYGRSGTGLLVSLVRQPEYRVPNTGSIKQLVLYRINPTFDRYDIVSVLPDAFLPRIAMPAIGVYSLEETDDGTVLFSLVTGRLHFSLNLLVYYYRHGVWRRSYTQLAHLASHVSPPVATSQLTLSPNPPGHFPLPVIPFSPFQPFFSNR